MFQGQGEAASNSEAPRGEAHTTRRASPREPPWPWSPTTQSTRRTSRRVWPEHLTTLLSVSTIQILLSCTKAFLQAAFLIFNARVASENGSGQSNGVMTNGDHAGTVLDIPLDIVLKRYSSRKSRYSKKGIYWFGCNFIFVVYCPFIAAHCLGVLQ